MHYNPILDTDSYKFSHWLQYPPGTRYVYSYIESRGGSDALFFGLQHFLSKYPTTVASRDLIIYRTIKRYLEETADSMEGLPFKLNDFGSRGVSSYESSEIGGMAHLVLFQGTDNVPAISAARKYYDAEMAGFSIPAAEHSTMTSWGGRDGELQAMANMVDRFAGQPLIACVSDSYDIYNAVSNYWGKELLQKVKDSGSTVVVRPDSGDPASVVLKVIELLMDRVGFTVNSKGYKVLPSYYRIIQGDGIDDVSVGIILQTLKEAGISADNVAFGMGGAMLQKLDRDTLKFAMKCSAIEVDGVWRDVFKDPITDHGKVSKRGRLDLFREEGRYVTRSKSDGLIGWRDRSYSALQDCFVDGVIVRREPLSAIRARAIEHMG